MYIQHNWRYSSVGTKAPTRLSRKGLHSQFRRKFSKPTQRIWRSPFFWWMGDTLTREHLSWHLEKLKDMHISSLQVNYAHDDKGGIIYGKTLPSKPGLFTDEWWNLFEWFLKEAKKYDMTVSLSDYTLGVGQGSYVDEMLNEDPSLYGYKLKFQSDTLVTNHYSQLFDNLPLSLNAYKIEKNGKTKLPGINLLKHIKNGKIEWKSVWNKTLITSVQAERIIPSLDPMNPQSGKSYVRHFFQKFEDRMPESAHGGLNFFFSDELNFNLTGLLWNDFYREEFRKRKGYDIVPYLDALYMDIGEMTPAIRLDFNDVLVSLSEENFFIPLYNWHAERGLLFGCDHGGRGRDVVEFGDYFRTQRWNQAPGCDQPYVQKDIIKNKVASSISHLYERERVWLEGFHSSGWSTNTEQLADAIFANYALGQNLLSLHGLYYSTMGGWWEWAPPCNHFHRAYWTEMKPLLACTERLSYILSQGRHRADVAMLYPVEPVIAGYGDNCVKTAFEAGEHLYKNGIDFDFIDYESLARATIENKALNVAGESFKVLIVPSMKAIRHSSLEKIWEFKRNGGIIINIGDKPEATEKGRKTKDVEKLLRKIYEDDKNPIYSIKSHSEIVSILDKEMTRDFKIVSGGSLKDIPYFQHRSINGQELYFVYNVAKSSQCFFRAKGKATLWNPWNGTTQPIPVQQVTEEGTIIQMPLEYSDVHIITFNPKEDPQIDDPHKMKRIVNHQILDKEWRFEIEPLLDNTYGDFILPAFNGKVGAMVYNAHYTNNNSDECKLHTFTQGTKFLVLGAAPEISPENLFASLSQAYSTIESNGRKYNWKPYDFSWRWGVENDYGHQGWHGLKARMYDNFIRLGKKEYTWNANEIKRVQEDNGEKNYYLFTRIAAPSDGLYQVEYGEMLPTAIYVNGNKAQTHPKLALKKGINEILLHFNSYGTTRFVLRSGSPDVIDRVLAESPLKMKYRGDKSLLLFDIRKDANTIGKFHFKSAPGLEALSFASYGKAKVTAGGIAAEMQITETCEDGLLRYQAKLPQKALYSVDVVIEVEEPWGYAGGSVIDGPIKQICSEGLIRIGDWSQIEGLKAYSGGAWYRLNLQLDSLQEQTILDLGKVISTARVKVNGQEVGVRLSGPWKYDISDKVRLGNNHIEVFVTNTSANFYTSTPSRYGGSIESGIIGPVSITSESKVVQ